MGTGGALPTQITQTVSLYNTTGLIEKDKNIYFCPFLSTSLSVPVQSAWKSKLDTINPPDTSYSGITISKWSPKDRTLTVQGSPDDFRSVTSQGKCLNYLLVYRQVQRAGGTWDVNYYAFFITDAVEVGNGSVRLSLESDDFTDLFYLHNHKLCNQYSGTYVDPFNEKLANCYVARQHYDRYQKNQTSKSNVDSGTISGTLDLSSLDFEVNIDSYLSDPINLSNIKIENVKLYYRDEDISEKILIYRPRLISNSWVLFLSADGRTLVDTDGYRITFTIYQDYGCTEINLPIFSQIEEGFKYKRQFRDYKEYINYGDPLTTAEKNAYNNANSWSDLSSALKIKALKLSTAFFHVVLNTQKIAIRQGAISEHYPAYAFPQISNNYPNTEIDSSLLTCVVPIYHQVDILSKFATEIKNILNSHFDRYYTSLTPAQTKPLLGVRMGKHYDITDFCSELSVLSEYVVSAYITKECDIFEKLVYTDSNISVTFKQTQIGYGDTDGFLIFASRSNISLEEQAEQIDSIVDRTTYYTIESNADDFTISVHNGTNHNMSNFMMFVESVKPISVTLDLTESRKSISNIKNTYLDPVLTFNPYSFYSVSYLGRIEVPLNKLNYYQSPIINCLMTVNASDVLKYSFTPIYEINGKEFKYYTEAIEQTFTNNLTIVNSSLTSYVIANQTQMKNQYAVNDLNHEYGLITNAVSGLGNIAGGAGRGAVMFGGAGAVAGAIGGAVQTTTSLINEAIDWDKDTKLTSMNQKAKLSDMGNLPSNLKQVGTDITIDLALNEMGLYLNHYTIDELSYNSICKYLERFGYVVNIYDSLNVNTRVGWDYIQLISFDYETEANAEQENNIRQILQNGVTLLHNKSVMTSGHNYEVSLD